MSQRQKVFNGVPTHKKRKWQILYELVHCVLLFELVREVHIFTYFTRIQFLSVCLFICLFVSMFLCILERTTPERIYRVLNKQKNTKVLLRVHQLSHVRHLLGKHDRLFKIIRQNVDSVGKIIALTRLFSTG